MLNLSATLIAFLSFVAVVLFICVMAYRNADRLEAVPGAKVPKKVTPTQWRSEINSGQTGVLAQNGQFGARASRAVHGSIILKSI